jgi:hypothetical protein
MAALASFPRSTRSGAGCLHASGISADCTHGLPAASYPPVIRGLAARDSADPTRPQTAPIRPACSPTRHGRSPAPGTARSTARSLRPSHATRSRLPGVPRQRVGTALSAAQRRPPTRWSHAPDCPEPRANVLVTRSRLPSAARQRVGHALSTARSHAPTRWPRALGRPELHPNTERCRCPASERASQRGWNSLSAARTGLLKGRLRFRVTQRGLRTRWDPALGSRESSKRKEGHISSARVDAPTCWDAGLGRRQPFPTCWDAGLGRREPLPTCWDAGLGRRQPWPTCWTAFRVAEANEPAGPDDAPDHQVPGPGRTNSTQVAGSRSSSFGCLSICASAVSARAAAGPSGRAGAGRDSAPSETSRW